MNTYGDWLREWLGERRPYLKETTAALYEENAARYILPVLGAVPLNAMTEECVQTAVFEWLAHGRCNGSGLSQRTVRGLVMMVRASLRGAQRAGLTERAPGEIRFPRSESAEKPKVLTMTEQAMLMQHIYLHLTPKNLGLLLCMQTGLRIGELCALRWEDIDLAERTVHVGRTLQRLYTPSAGTTRLTETSPKTVHSVRTVPLSTLLLPVLRQMDPGDPAAYLLTGKRKPTEPRTYREYYNRLRDKLGLSAVTFHGLRHTFATRLIENGVDYKTVSELLGHASVNITLNLYVHPQMEQKRRAVEMLCGCIGG